MKKTVIAICLALALSLTCLVGCGPLNAAIPAVQLASGGTLILKVNPEIAIAYDDAGKVTGLTARNEDAKAIIAAAGDLTGQTADEAVIQLVAAIEKAGYFLEEVEGNPRTITLEIETGSVLPNDTFLEDVVKRVENYVTSNNTTVPLDIDRFDDKGFTDYRETDYGIAPTVPAADPTAPAATEPAAPTGPYTDYGKTDYNDPATDYDHHTDYGKTDYNDPATDYDHHTDYGKTDYDHHTDHDHHTDYGKTDYDKDSRYD